MRHPPLFLVQGRISCVRQYYKGSTADTAPVVRAVTVLFISVGLYHGSRYTYVGYTLRYKIQRTSTLCLNAGRSRVKFSPGNPNTAQLRLLPNFLKPSRL